MSSSFSLYNDKLLLLYSARKAKEIFSSGGRHLTNFGLDTSGCLFEILVYMAHDPDVLTSSRKEISF